LNPYHVFLKIYLGGDLNNLFKLAKHLRIQGLQNNIAAFISTKIHMKLSIE